MHIYCDLVLYSTQEQTDQMATTVPEYSQIPDEIDKRPVSASSTSTSNSDSEIISDDEFGPSYSPISCSDSESDDMLFTSDQESSIEMPVSAEKV